MQSARSYPLMLRGELTEPLNCWLFLVKWLLALPHVVVLAFLFVGFVVSWLISLFAILFTGRYPRGLFDYNVGVLRWAWRVGFYTYQARRWARTNTRRLRWRAGRTIRRTSALNIRSG